MQVKRRVDARQPQAEVQPHPRGDIDAWSTDWLKIKSQAAVPPERFTVSARGNRSLMCAELPLFTIAATGATSAKCSSGTRMSTWSRCDAEWRHYKVPARAVCGERQAYAAAEDATKPGLALCRRGKSGA